MTGIDGQNEVGSVRHLPSPIPLPDAAGFDVLAHPDTADRIDETPLPVPQNRQIAAILERLPGIRHLQLGQLLLHRAPDCNVDDLRHRFRFQRIQPAAHMTQVPAVGFAVNRLLMKGSARPVDRVVRDSGRVQFRPRLRIQRIDDQRLFLLNRLPDRLLRHLRHRLHDGRRHDRHGESVDRVVTEVAALLLPLPQQIVAAPRAPHHSGTPAGTALKPQHAVAIPAAAVEKRQIFGGQFARVTGVVEIALDEVAALRLLQLEPFQLGFRKRPFEPADPLQNLPVRLRGERLERQSIPLLRIRIATAQRLVDKRVIHRPRIRHDVFNMHQPAMQKIPHGKTAAGVGAGVVALLRQHHFENVPPGRLLHPGFLRDLPGDSFALLFTEPVPPGDVLAVFAAVLQVARQLQPDQVRLAVFANHRVDHLPHLRQRAMHDRIAQLQAGFVQRRQKLQHPFRRLELLRIFEFDHRT